MSPLTIEESAFLAGVSPSTIRNWLRTGYLEPAGKGMVSRDSFRRFQKEISGKEKLRQRANKSRKDSHDRAQTTLFYLDKIRSRAQGAESLALEYEQHLPDSYRNREGIYYTPPAIVADFFSGDFAGNATAKFCDPCCGSGNFVMQALALGFRPENIFAYDVDPVAVAITEKRIYEKTGFRSGNIGVADFLESRAGGRPEQFDCIFTNPPWGKKLARKHRERIGAAVQAGSSLDTCSLFFFACLAALVDGGRLGLLLPEAFFNISSFEDARKSALRHRIDKLIDYGKPFPGLLTGARGMVLTKGRDKKSRRIICKTGADTVKRTAASFAGNPKSIINMHCSQPEADAIAHLYSIPHLTLKNNASWGLGIVTGNNARFVAARPGPGLLPVLRGADITASGIRAPSSYIPADMSPYQQVAPLELYQAREKIVYKFISSRLCFAYDPARRFVLNSANLLIPDPDFPVPMPILCALFNSDFMNWLFSRIYNTRKILRADLESLPIHAQFLAQDAFVEAEYIAGLGLEKTPGGTYAIRRS